MKKILITLLLFGLTFGVKSQNASVEKSTFGIQTGYLGVWIHNEFRLSNQLTLRSELGVDTSIWEGDFYSKTGFFFAPVISLEPRWYYNLDRRESQSKRIDRNSANFISLKTSYHPDWFVISKYDNVNVVNDISIIPTWGIRRAIGKHLIYETAFGIGYVYYFSEDAGYLKDEGETTINLHLRIGYSF